MWYRIGTVQVTNGSPNVVGTGTAWVANLRQSWAFVAPDGKAYEVLSVVDDTHMTLATNYAGASLSGQAYQAYPTQGELRDLAAQVVALISSVGGMVAGAGAGKFGDGSAAAPGISFAADADCGFYRYGTNAIGGATAGALRWLTDASGNFIVGGTAAVYGAAGRGVVTINGSGSALLGFTVGGLDMGFLFHSGTNMTLSNTVAGAITFQTSNTERARIDASGNLIQMAPAVVPSLTSERQLVLNMVSNTVLRISGRGADGTTRSVDLTLA